MNELPQSELVVPQLSNRVMAPMWRYVAEGWGEALADEVFTRAGLPRDYVLEQGGWVSFEYARRVQLELGRVLFGLEEEPPVDHPVWDIYRQVGRRSLDRESLGPMWYVLRLLGRPQLVYAAAERQAKRFNRMSTLRMTGHSRGLVTLEAWTDGEAENPGLCASRVGFLESTPQLWDLPMARVEHDECVHRPDSGATRCTYRVSYQAHSPPWQLGLLGALVGCGVGAAIASLLGGVHGILVAAGVGALAGLAWAGWTSYLGLRRLQLADADRISDLLEDQDQWFKGLVEGERRLQQVADALPQVFWLATPDRAYQYLSPSYEVLTGRRRQEGLTHGPWTGLQVDEPRPPEASGDEPTQRVFRIEVPGRGLRSISERTFPVRDTQGETTHVAGLAEDITESLEDQESLRRQEEELKVARRLEAVGRLAGGVAHDFNNLLTVIGASARFVMDALGEEHPAAGDVDQVLQATDRATGLTRQLLAYSRKQVLDLAPCDLNRVVGQTTDMLERLLPEDVLLQVEFDDRNPWVWGDDGQLAQVVMNLAVNAVDAMPGGGRLVVGTSVEVRQGPLEHGDGVLIPGTYAVLSVTDTGQGMDAEVLERAQEPFFSTKESHKGTGLGLSTVAGIVGQHRGAIRFESELGQGTQVRVWLPLAVENQERPATADSLPPSVAGGTVLVVEDEVTLRRLCARILRKGGYRVIESDSPEEAVVLGADLSIEIDLLLTDVVMPGMSGTDVARAIRAHRSELVVLYTSGYADDVVAERGLDETSAFLAKPYGPSDLLDAVAATLRRVRAASGSRG